MINIEANVLKMTTKEYITNSIIGLLYGKREGLCLFKSKGNKRYQKLKALSIESGRRVTPTEKLANITSTSDLIE